MKTGVTILFILSLGLTFAQDTVYVSGAPGDYWIDYYDSIEKFYSKNYCWRREQYFNDTLFSVERLALNKTNPVSKYIGYYPNGNVSFVRNYLYVGENSELHGQKELRYENGNLKQKGLYHHGVKYGNWVTYNPDGSKKVWSQYDTPIVDTLSMSKHLRRFSDKVIMDTITVEHDSTYHDYFPCISFGKNGIEVIYRDDKPFEVRLYEFDSLILTTRKKFKMKKLIRNCKILPDTMLCGHKPCFECY